MMSIVTKLISALKKTHLSSQILQVKLLELAMKGYTLAICMPLVAAIWLWFRFQQLPLPLPPLATTSNDSKLVPLEYEYPVVKFTTVGATGESYAAFITELRNRIVTGEDMRHGIPVLCRTVDIRYRFILVELTNRQGVTITLAIDVINLYVVGYRSGYNAIFLRPDNDADREAITNLFPHASQQTLTNRGNYDDLERNGRARSEVNLGLYALDNAISALEGYATGGHGIVTLQDLLCSFIVCIQMISEAARFNLIQHDIRVRIEDNQERPPDSRLISLENNWGSLSEQIQTSNQGVFVRPVQLSQRNNEPLPVDSLSPALIRNMGVMLYSCANSRMNNWGSRDYESDEDVCAYNEPTVRINGPNGLCADVYKGEFYDGNSIILFPCKTNTDPNQFWTLKRDGTIRSNGRCLTIYGYNPGDPVMMYHCDCASIDDTRWEVWDNGTIIHSASGLVLTAKSWDQGVKLTVETNVYTTSQSWRPTNNTQPFVASIVGYEDLCLRGNGEDVYVEHCEVSKQEQQWALYPDGSIRPQEKQQYCLTEDGDSRGTVVKIFSCKIGSSAQRWEFKNDGSIWNLNSGLVMGVEASEPGLQLIDIEPYYGTENQIWNVVY
ncbi:ricin-like [Mercurialis annua]|uniref:ricin-like n=1 Tax=Mercurialis annua TaxID=3986 RepID=UPI00215ED8AE|nr:ricin-like [Mercurialis annua]